MGFSNLLMPRSQTRKITLTSHLCAWNALGIVLPVLSNFDFNRLSIKMALLRMIRLLKLNMDKFHGDWIFPMFSKLPRNKVFFPEFKVGFFVDPKETSLSNNDRTTTKSSKFLTLTCLEEQRTHNTKPLTDYQLFYSFNLKEVKSDTSVKKS